jgi:hypothetical protein
VLVANLARPGGNVTGLSVQSADLAGKRLEILRELLPGLRRLAIMANVGYAAAALEMREVQAAARTLGLDAATIEIRRAEDIAPAIEALRGRADALYVCTDALVNANHMRINTWTLGLRTRNPRWQARDNMGLMTKERDIVGFVPGGCACPLLDRIWQRSLDWSILCHLGLSPISEQHLEQLEMRGRKRGQRAPLQDLVDR